MAATPGEIIRSSPMSLTQFLVVGLCVLTYAADGIDVSSITYAAPALAKEWGIRPQLLGITYSVTPIGVVLASLFLAPLGDRFGRRNITLVALGAMTLVLFATAFVTSIGMLAALRFCIGVCIGTLVVSLNVMVAEFANEQRRNLLIGIMHTGYTLGGAACAALAAVLIAPHGWRSLFLAAAAINLAVFVLNLLFLSESPDFLVTRQPKGALERLNKLFTRMKMPTFEALPPPAEKTKKHTGYGVLLAPELQMLTILLCVTGFVFTVSGSFLAAWRPQILIDAGLDYFWNGIAGVIASGAGILGHIVSGALAKRGGETRLAATLMVCMAGAMVLLGLAPEGNRVALIAAASVTTFFTVASYTSLVVVALSLYKSENRNAGLGLMVGFERMGGILGPTLGGFVIGAGVGRPATLATFAAIMLIAVTGILIARWWTMNRAPAAAVG